MATSKSSKAKDREIRSNLVAIRNRSSSGHYSETDLTYVIEAANFLRRNSQFTLDLLAQETGLSASGLRKILNSPSYTPRYYNFHKLISALIDISSRSPKKKSSVALTFEYQWPAQWVANPIFGNSTRIDEVRRHLEHFVDAVRGVNDSGVIGITDLERAELLALLKTAVELLGAPKIEKGLLKKIADAGQDIAARSIASGGATVIGDAARFAFRAIRGLLGV